MISSKDISFFAIIRRKYSLFYPGRKIGIIVFVLPYKNGSSSNLVVSFLLLMESNSVFGSV
ncbi:hypothetical protein M080_8171, partial [Bacteroides fragilis str. 3397 T10]